MLPGQGSQLRGSSESGGRGGQFQAKYHKAGSGGWPGPQHAYRFPEQPVYSDQAPRFNYSACRPPLHKGKP